MIEFTWNQLTTYVLAKKEEKGLRLMSRRLLCVLVLISLLIVWPAVAQDFEEAPGPGLGGIVIHSSTADDPATFNPLIGGEFSILAVPSTRQDEFRTDQDLLHFPCYEFTGNGFTFFGMNHANPANPQPGIDKDGNLLPQEPHPVLGDRLVRQAISHAVDMDALIEGIRYGNGFKVATHTIPTSWVYNPDLQYELNPELAMEKLTQAGWIDHDKDPETARVCQDCLFAREVDSEFNGEELTVNLHVPAGSDIGEQMGLFFHTEMNKV